MIPLAIAVMLAMVPLVGRSAMGVIDESESVAMWLGIAFGVALMHLLGAGVAAMTAVIGDRPPDIAAAAGSLAVSAWLIFQSRSLRIT